MTMKQGLEPVVDKNSRVLILGTLPGDESLRLGQYYANPANQFWSILSCVYGEEIGTNYNDRLNFLRGKGLALWDVLRAAERIGSKDENIKNEAPNDFLPLFKKYPRLRTIVLTSGKARTLFRKHVTKVQLTPAISLREEQLPSTSSRRGKNIRPIEEKVIRWKAFLNP
jgi:hypoxanthine-DNA glycosylase